MDKGGGQLALGIAGAIAGSFIPGVGPAMGFSAGMMIGGALGLGAKDDFVQEGPKLSDIRFNASAYGQGIPFGRGHGRITCQPFWGADREDHPHEETTQAGGKGGGSEATARTWTTTIDCAYRVCDGPVDAVLRVWRNGVLIADFTTTDGPAIGRQFKGGLAIGADMRFYFGTEDQDPDPAIVADLGVEDTPAYLGVCYLVLDNHDITDIGSLPQMSVQVARGTMTTVYPTDSVTPGITVANPVGRDISQDGFLYVGHNGGLITKIDLASRTIVAEKDHSAELGGTAHAETGAIDSLGRLYGARDTAFTSVIYQFDPDTLAVVGEATGHPGRATELLVPKGLPGFERVWVINRSANVNLLRIYETGVAVDPGNDDPPTALPLYLAVDMDEVLDAADTASSWTIHGMADSEDGNVWLIVRHSISTYGLVKMTVGGLFVSYHELHDDGGSVAALTLGFDRDRYQLLYHVDDSGADIFGGFDLATETIAFEARQADGDTVVDFEDASILRHGPDADGYLYKAGGTTLWRVSAEDGSVVETTSTSSDWGLAGLNYRGAVYDPVNHAVVATAGADWDWMFLDRLSAESGKTTYQALVEQVAEKCGYVVDTDIDASNLTGEVIGRWSLRGSGRSHLEALQSTGFFDVVRNGAQIVFPLRGGASVATIDIEDLGAHEAASGREAPLVPTRDAEIENLPFRVEVTLPDPDLNFDPNLQSEKRNRNAVATRRVLSIRDDLVAEADTGKAIARKALYLAWLNRTSYAFKLTRKWAKLLPADVITITDGAVAYKMLLVEITDTANGIREVKALAEDVALYSYTGEGAPGTGMPLPTVPNLAKSVFYLMDLPLLRDADDGLILYLAAGSFGVAGWPGCSILQSDDGTSYTTPFTFVPNEVTHGVTVDALDDGRPWTWDEDSTVTVRLHAGTLSSITVDQWANDGNAMLIGGEVVCFQTATLNSDGSYTLSHFRRGLANTEFACTDHDAGERAVLLTASTVQRKSYDAVKIGDQDFYAGVTLGDTLAHATKRSLTPTGASIKPPACVHVAGSRDGSNNLTITADARSRLGKAFPVFGEDPPMGELEESYETDILDGGGTVLRTIETSTPSISYTAAEQAADGLTPGAAVSGNLYKLGRNGIRGFPAAFTV